MLYFLTAAQAAELIVNGLVVWRGPHCDIVVEPAHGMRCLVARGDGRPEQGFQRAQELRVRLRAAIAAELDRFAQEFSAENRAAPAA